MRCSLEIEIGGYLYDHHFEGRCVLPAVEALIVLAKIVEDHFPDVPLLRLSKALFPRFLVIPPDGHHLPAIVETDHSPEGSVLATLMTSVRSKTGGIGRNLAHARVEFPPADSLDSEPLFPDRKKPDEDPFMVPADLIYPGLIPFGKAFQNVSGPLSLWPAEASAFLSGGESGPENTTLGSPFPLDAAFHLACVWGHRFTGQVLFPTGFEKRIICQRTKKGDTYLGRIFPTGSSLNVFLFDALILDSQGAVYEDIRGIQMQDVSQGRLRPPSWIRDVEPV
jgi:hypothetical protein